jgi:caffeoyl-CoA O-methyltransferase
LDIIDPAVSDYVLEHSTPADDLLRDLAQETRDALPDESGMQVSHDEGGLLTMLARLTGARRAVEVGVFTGYSSICIARGLAADGHLLACDVSEEFTSIARRYWARDGVADRIELRLGPAAQTLREMPEQPHIDLAFIDADKGGYPTYWAELVPRMRPGGVILIDNVLRHGRVLDPRTAEDQVIVQFNRDVLADDRTESVMLPIADGLTLARRK